MPAEFSYQREAIDSVAQSVNDVELTPRQRELVQSLGTVVGPMISMPEEACRGFWIRAISEWQAKTGGKIGDIEKATPERRLLVVKQVAKIFTQLAVQSLANPAKDLFLQRAIAEGMQLYLLRFWKRAH